MSIDDKEIELSNKINRIEAMLRQTHWSEPSRQIMQRLKNQAEVALRAHRMANKRRSKSRK